MKKLTALFILLIFLFNLFGYRLAVEYMQQKVNNQLEASLDNNSYDDSRLIELKVPINVPYQTSCTAYQRYDGEIEINGLIYKYVKRKIANDTLYVMCIPNINKMHLESVKNDFFKLTNDLQNNSQKPGNSKTISFKNQQNEYDQYSFSIKDFLPVMDQHTFWLPEKCMYALSSIHISPEQPPDINRS